MIGIFHPKEYYNKLLNFVNGGNIMIYWRSCAVVDCLFALLSTIIYIICCSIFGVSAIMGKRNSNHDGSIGRDKKDSSLDKDIDDEGGSVAAGVFFLLFFS